MERFIDNAKWLLWFTPFKGLSISSAFITPFFIEHGLTLAQIFTLQAIFSVAYMLLEVPSGYVADKIGRALCIKISTPLAAIGLFSYGMSDNWWQFVACELLLAIANSLLSGADTALLYDSLKAGGRTSDYERITKRMNALSYTATAVCMPLGVVLVYFFNLSIVVAADGILMLGALPFAFRLVEAPHKTHGSAAKLAWRDLALLAKNAEFRWLTALTVSLSTATYVGFWLSAPAYEALGIPVAAFGVILALRSLWKAAWAHWCHPKVNLVKAMGVYIALAVGGYLAVASGQWWLAWLIIGHDVVQALQGPAILQRLNGYMTDAHRATLNSMVNLMQRFAYATVGPLAGFIVDKAGLQNGLIVIGGMCGACAILALMRLHHHKTFTTD